MTSITEIEKKEAALRKAIAKEKQQIQDIHASIQLKELELKDLCENKQAAQEESFEKIYGKHPEIVRKEYLDLVERCSYQGGMGHTVRVPGYSGHRHHWVLHPKHYKVCKPTMLVIEAYATIGQKVSIAPKPHQEIWGN
jgi:hypothetical protein